MTTLGALIALGLLAAVSILFGRAFEPYLAAMFVIMYIWGGRDERKDQS